MVPSLFTASEWITPSEETSASAAAVVAYAPIRAAIQILAIVPSTPRGGDRRRS